MKRLIFVFVSLILVSVLAISIVSAVSAAAGPVGCGSPKLPEGECITDKRIENVATDTGDYLEFNTSFGEGRWLVKVAKEVPTFAVLPFNTNLNKFRLELVDVYVDQRTLNTPPTNEGEFFDGVYVFVKLVCDQSGSMKPTMAFSMPGQFITLADGTSYHRIPRATSLHVINWKSATSQPCSY